MKSQRSMFKWFAVIIAFVMLFESALVLPSVSAQGENTPTPTPQPTYTQSAASVSFAGFDGSYGLNGNDVYSYGGSYNNGFIINYNLTSVDSHIWFPNDPNWYVHLRINFTTSGSAAGVYVRNDAEANGTFFYSAQPNVFSVDIQPYSWDTSALGNRPNRYGLGHVVADGLDPFQAGWVNIDLAAEENSSASFSGTLYFQPQPVLSTPTPQPTSTPAPTSDCSPDTFEPDNTSSTGSPIIMGEVQRHSLCPQGDQDWVSFQTTDLQPNLLAETFDLEPDSIHPNGNTQLTVLDESANQIGTNQFRGFGPFPGSPDSLQSSRVVWHPATDGRFNITVFPEMPINEQAASGYSLRLANPSINVDPVDQGSWAPTKVNVPVIFRNGSTIYFIQHFTYEQAELDALINLDATLAWEFRRPAVDPNGVEQANSVDYGDYWQNVGGVCKGNFWTNLPSTSDRFAEESNSISGCRHNSSWSEELELYVDNPTQLVADKCITS